MKHIHELGALFEEVQLQNILGDGKTFPDCTPRQSLSLIQAEYEKLKGKPGFDLKKFIVDHFDLPPSIGAGYQPRTGQGAEEHIESLWTVLTRSPEKASGSLLSLPFPYVVPGGRFREIYYWDSYFTMLGLRVSKRWDLIHHMVDNFNHLIETIGYIPNGNRSYFLGRSQPPFFSLMIKLLVQENLHDPSGKFQVKYLKALEAEHAFWMMGAGELSAPVSALHRVVRMPDGSILNRYWDENDTPRPEAYKEDVELAHHSKQPHQQLYRHLRAATESGWDFSTRWFSDPNDFGSIHTTDIVPVDLNCLLWHLEETLSDAYQLAGDTSRSLDLMIMAEKRRESIQKYFWNPSSGWFCDYDWTRQQSTTALTLAGCFPLFFEIATSQQAAKTGVLLRTQFLKPGGLTTSLTKSGQQWDAPNGWAPLQWIAYRGLLHYGHKDLAHTIKTHWLNANTRVFEKTGKMTEKYDVWTDDVQASGGEYPNQDGFGWTNGVFLAMMHDAH
jgi:alpha,alpha-trehalase